MEQQACWVPTHHVQSGTCRRICSLLRYCICCTFGSSLLQQYHLGLVEVVAQLWILVVGSSSEQLHCNHQEHSGGSDSSPQIDIQRYCNTGKLVNSRVTPCPLVQLWLKGATQKKPTHTNNKTCTTSKWNENFNIHAWHKKQGQQSSSNLNSGK